MIITNKILKRCFLGITLIIFAGCDSLLETVPPESVTPEEILSNLEGMEGLATSFHDRLNATAYYGREQVLSPDILADNTDQHPVTSGRGDQLAVNEHGAHMGLYGTGYRAINEANYLIHGIDELENVSNEKRDLLLGMAYFIRALSYHTLAKIYAYEPGREINGWDTGVVIRSEPTQDVSDADGRPRETNQKVYDLIVNDLEEAIGLLPVGMDYEVDFANGRWTNPIFWANHQTALALMARVQLYLENWQAAADYATQAMEASGDLLVDADDYVESWNAYPDMHPEALFISIAASSGSGSGVAGYTQPRYWFDVIPSQSLIDSYEEGDVRLELFEEHTDGYPNFTKFDGRNDDTPTDDIPVFRYPELLLIRAEAYAELNQESDAITELETLRAARGLDSYSNPPSGDNLIMEILDERRRELAWEGHRWFDFKRRAMDIPKQGGLPTISYDDYRILAPYYRAEVEDFPEIVQNPGY